MKLHILILCVFFLAVGCNTQLQETENVESKWNIKYFEKNYSSMTNVVEGIVLISATTHQELKLKIGESIYDSDHHSSKAYTLLKTNIKGAFFTYELTFDHRSFGKDLIQKDKGTFFVQWKGL